MAYNERDEQEMDPNEQSSLYEEEKVYESDTFGERLDPSDDDMALEDEDVIVEEEVIVAEAVPAEDDSPAGFGEKLAPESDEPDKASAKDSEAEDELEED